MPESVVPARARTLGVGLTILVLLSLLTVPAAGGEHERRVDVLDCLDRSLDEGTSAPQAVVACLPGVELDQLTVVDLGVANAQCALYSQWPYVTAGPAPLAVVPTVEWGALSVCDVDAVHAWVGRLENVDAGATTSTAPGVSEGPTRVATFFVEQPCASVPDGSYQVTVVGQYKPLELTALPVAAVDTSSPHHIDCPAI